MTKDQIPAALIQKVRNANEKGTGYTVSPGMNKIWFTVAESLKSNGTIIYKDGAFWLSAEEINLESLKSIVKPSVRKSTTPAEIPQLSPPRREIRPVIRRILNQETVVSSPIITHPIFEKYRSHVRESMQNGAEPLDFSMFKIESERVAA